MVELGYGLKTVLLELARSYPQIVGTGWATSLPDSRSSHVQETSTASQNPRRQGNGVEEALFGPREKLY
jgi:hypothetical protein